MRPKTRALAWATVGVTFILICWGGLVHNTGSSLACPDWPLCFGRVFPEMKGGVFFEHNHRYLGTTVGLLAIALVGALWRTRWRGLALVALVLVSVQGVIGGMTVIHKLPWWVSTAHLAVSMLVFALMLSLAQGERVVVEAPGIHRAVLVTLGLAYLQMVLGAAMRHLGAGLACFDVPFCHGEAWPTQTGFQELHMAHRWLGAGVAVSTVWVALAARRTPRLRALGWAAPALAGLQVTVGLLSVTTGLAILPVTAHLGIAALLFADLLSLWLRVRAAPSTVAHGAAVPA